MTKLKSNKGKGSGLMLIIILIVAVIVAYLVVTQMGGLGVGKQETQQEQTQENVVEQAQDAVDAINERMQQDAAQEP